jgi:predicted nucleotide-binding protein
MSRKTVDRIETETKPSKTKRAYVSQSDLPSRPLREALRVPQTITDNYAGDPTAPHDVALALDISPTSSGWRELAAGALGYGLTKGSWNAERISLEPLGRRATAPTEEGDELRARAEAALKPKVLAGFFRKYNKNKFPADQIAKNVLQQEFNVPVERLDTTLQLIKDNGQYVGFIRETKTGPFVAIDDPQPRPVRLPPEPQENPEIGAEQEEGGQNQEKTETRTPGANSTEFRVFISHSKNMGIVEQVKDILGLYDIDFEIAVEEETAAIPVPAKVMAAMRRCQSGIMVVTADEQNRKDDGFNINTNVLIEIGAAFVLYDQGVILVWDRRLKVPSNLQGLYRLEFEGDELSFSSGTKLAKAVKSLKRG